MAKVNRVESKVIGYNLPLTLKQLETISELLEIAESVTPVPNDFVSIIESIHRMANNNSDRIDTIEIQVRFKETE